VSPRLSPQKSGTSWRPERDGGGAKPFPYPLSRFRLGRNAPTSGPLRSLLAGRGEDHPGASRPSPPHVVSAFRCVGRWRADADAVGQDLASRASAWSPIASARRGWSTSRGEAMGRAADREGRRPPGRGVAFGRSGSPPSPTGHRRPSPRGVHAGRDGGDDDGQRDHNFGAARRRRANRPGTDNRGEARSSAHRSLVAGRAMIARGWCTAGRSYWSPAPPRVSRPMAPRAVAAASTRRRHRPRRTGFTGRSGRLRPSACSVSRPSTKRSDALRGLWSGRCRRRRGI
jgi:hypothetical protein